MKLKNELIIALAQSGAATLTANSLCAKSAYAVIKFRREIKRAFGAIQEEEKELIASCGLEIADGGVIVGPDERKDNFANLRSSLCQDLTEVADLPSIPFDDWHELKKENKWLASPVIEDALEGVLWAAPED